MASIRERTDSSGKKSYHVQVRLKGFPPQTQTFDSKTMAKQWASHVESELIAGRFMPRSIAQGHTVKELLDDYRDKVLKARSPKEVATQTPHIKYWIEKLGSYSLADLSPEAIAKCRDELMRLPFGKNIVKTRQAATVVRYMVPLSRALNIAVNEWKWLSTSPVPQVEMPKVKNQGTRFLSELEKVNLIQQVKDSENSSLYSIVIMTLLTGMRKGEVTNLRWKNITFNEKDKSALIYLPNVKGDKSRGVPLVGPAYAAVVALREQHLNANSKQIRGEQLLFPGIKDPKKPLDFRSAWRTAMKNAGVAKFRFHDLRHTAASYLAMEGASASELAEILGHESLEMVKRYAHFDKDHVSKVLTRMSASRFGDDDDAKVASNKPK